MKLFVEVAEEQIAYHSGSNEQRHLQALVIFNLNAVEIRLHDGQLLQAREKSDSNVGLFALLDLLAGRVGRFACHVAGHILAQPSLLPPREVDSGCVHIGARIRHGAVEGGIARRPEGDLRYAELPAYSAAPFRCRVLNNNARVGVVHLDREFCGVDRLRWRRYAAILANLLLRECWMRPSGLRKHFAI